MGSPSASDHTQGNASFSVACSVEGSAQGHPTCQQEVQLLPGHEVQRVADVDHGGLGLDGDRVGLTTHWQATTAAIRMTIMTTMVSGRPLVLTMGRLIRYVPMGEPMTMKRPRSGRWP